MKLYAVVGVSNIDGDLNKNLQVCTNFPKAKKIFDDWVKQDEEIYADRVEDFEVTKTETSYLAYETDNFTETAVWKEIEEVTVLDGEVKVLKGGTIKKKNDNLRRI